MSRTAPKQEALSEPLSEKPGAAVGALLGLELKDEAHSESPGASDELEEDEGGGLDSWFGLAAQARQLKQEDHPDADADAGGQAVEVRQGRCLLEVEDGEVVDGDLVPELGVSDLLLCQGCETHIRTHTPCIMRRYMVAAAHRGNTPL